MSGAHKWLFGPRGTGFVWAKAEVWPRVHPIFTSFSEAGLVGWLTGRPPAGYPSDLNTPGGFHSYEHRWALAEAIEFHQAIGRARIAARTHAQVAQLKAGLAELPHVRLVTPRSPGLSGGLICCSIKDMAPGDAARRLQDEHHVIAGATPYPQSLLRLGPSIVTSPHQVRKAVKAFAALG